MSIEQLIALAMKSKEKKAEKAKKQKEIRKLANSLLANYTMTGGGG